MTDSGKTETTALTKVTGNKELKLVYYLNYLVDNDLLPDHLPSYHLDYLVFNAHERASDPDTVEELQKKMRELQKELNWHVGIPVSIINGN